MGVHSSIFPLLRTHRLEIFHNLIKKQVSSVDDGLNVTAWQDSAAYINELTQDWER